MAYACGDGMTPREQYEDALFREAMWRVEQRRAARLAAEGGAVAEEAKAAYERALPALHRALEKGLGRNRRRRFFRHTLPRVGRVAAAALLIAFLGGTAALAAIRPLRVYLTRFLISTTEVRTELGLEVDEERFVDVPGDWPGSYYPTYVPEGFEVAQVRGDEVECGVRYDNAADQSLYFDENTADTRMFINTEGAKIGYGTIRGQQAMFAEQEADGYCFVTWAVADRFFVVRYDGDLETAKRVAGSVTMIK